MRKLGTMLTLISIALLISGEAKGQISIETLLDTTLTAKPPRPPRPEKPHTGKNLVERPNLTEIQDVVKNLKDQKRQFLRALRDQKPASHDLRVAIREQVKEYKVTVGTLIQEAKESIGDAKRVALEQSRKLAQEAEMAAREERGHR